MALREERSARLSDVVSNTGAEQWTTSHLDQDHILRCQPVDDPAPVIRRPTFPGSNGPPWNHKYGGPSRPRASTIIIPAEVACQGPVEIVEFLLTLRSKGDADARCCKDSVPSWLALEDAGLSQANIYRVRFSGLATILTPIPCPRLRSGGRLSPSRRVINHSFAGLTGSLLLGYERSKLWSLRSA